MEPFSVIGLMIIVVLALFFGRIMTVAFKVLFYTLIAVLVTVFLFGISLNEILIFVEGIILLAF